MTEDREQQVQSPTMHDAHAECSSAPALDLDRYLPMTEELDLSDDDRRELIETLWNILLSIADLGLGLDPIQMLLADDQENTTSTPDNPVQSSYSTKKKSRPVDSDIDREGE